MNVIAMNVTYRVTYHAQYNVAKSVCRKRQQLDRESRANVSDHINGNNEGNIILKYYNIFKVHSVFFPK